MNNETDEQTVQRLYEEVTAERDKMLDEHPVDWEQEKKEAVEHYKATPMYDWATKMKSNQQDMTDKYGSEIVNEILECDRNCVKIPSYLIHEIHCIHEGKKPHPKKRKNEKVVQIHKRQNIEWDKLGQKKLQAVEYENKYFIKNKKAGVFNMARKAKSLQNPSTLLDYLLQHKAWKNKKTGEYKKDKHNTYTDWYVKRKLIVASRSVDQMAVDLGVSKSTIIRWTRALENDGIIQKVKVGLENVYVLGKVVGDKELYYYAGEINLK